MATINGTAATDILEGTNVADLLSGLGGSDSIAGSDSNDRLYGGTGSDWLDGGAGNDKLVGGQGDDNFVGGPGNDTFDGSNNQIDYDWAGYQEERGTQGVVVNLATGTAIDSYGSTDTLIDIEEVAGTRFADRLTGGNTANNDWEAFKGGAGADTINGGSGFDAAFYFFDTFDDGNFGIVANLVASTVRDAFGSTDVIKNIEMITATMYSDVLTGDSRDNRFDPVWGDDVIDGGGGVDMVSYRNDVRFAQNSAYSHHGIDADLGKGVIYDVRGNEDKVSNIENLWGSALEDEIRGNASNNLLDGYSEDDVIAGRGGDDNLYGAEGHDKVYGGTGNDLMGGGLGGDVLWGGLGNDTFYIELNSDSEIIRDFVHGTDKVDVYEFKFTSGSQVLSKAVQRGPDVVIELSHDTVIEFLGMKVSDLGAGDFLV
jgi:Ca2+-binding RTX toxin-like protein